MSLVQYYPIFWSSALWARGDPAVEAARSTAVGQGPAASAILTAPCPQAPAAPAASSSHISAARTLPQSGNNEGLNNLLNSCYITVITLKVLPLVSVSLL